ncbi:claudin-23-like [Latimeria chalumnae]|uniref:claudin-23-like n=1 Tax=Latimeria chalumnae TaxID=7897 RepID=UPI0003C10583
MITASMVVGLVVTPIGWILILAATVTPQWRQFHERPGYPLDIDFYDGLWETCTEVRSIASRECKPLSKKVSTLWFLQLTRALAVTSVVGSIFSYWVANLGVHWWTWSPNPNITGVAGILITLCGATYLCATSYMAYRILYAIANPKTPEEEKFQIGTCVYLGWFGGVAEMMAGIVLIYNFKCQKRPLGAKTNAAYEVDY